MALSSGWEALERDDFGSAEALARQALAADPRDGEALYLLGSALLFANRFEQALDPLREALRLARRRGMGHRLGYCLLALGQFEAAEQVLRAEVQEYPDLVHAYNALGVALVEQSKREEALAAFREAARRDPQSVEANSNVANVLSELGRDAEALPYLQKAVAANPQLADAQHNLGALLQGLKRHEEAIAAFDAALRLAPRMSYSLSYAAWNELAICRWGDLAARSEALRRQVREGIPVAPFVFVALDVPAEEQRVCAERHVREKFAAPGEPLWRGARYGHRKLRIAYLSADFHEHATAQLAARLFELHDRSRFEVVALSYGPHDASPMRKRLEAAFDRFVDARAQGDAEAARALRDMEIDIAVDLKGHTTGARLGILARRPAPLQVSYLGFPGTTGAPFIDYLLADRVVVPPGDERFYSESIACLPDCYQVNDGQRFIAERAVSRAEAGLPERAFVFCCFNNSYKIQPPVFAVWMRLLAAIAHSVLWLIEDNASASANLRDAARAAGVDPARLVFAPRMPHAGHLARHRLADLFLDTLPYNAHTTASDALWAGLPVLTAAGRSFAGRVAASLLLAVGLPELIAGSMEEYEQLARSLAADPARLARLKRALERNRTVTPLFDTDRFRRGIEAAYLTMWQRHEEGRPPASFSISDAN
jgi:protein O-GlcNAc transferase